MGSNGKSGKFDRGFPAPAPDGRTPVFWGVQLRIPVDVRLIRRASPTALRKALAQLLVASVRAVPPEFIDQSAEKVRAELERQRSVLVAQDGQPFRM